MSYLSRFMPVALAIALTAAASAQITSGSSKIGYNDGQRAYNSDLTYYRDEQQFLVEDNPPTTTLTAPFADYIFTNPLNLASGELKGNSAITSVFSLSPTSASVTGHGFAQSEVITNDATDTYFSYATAESNMTLHLASDGFVTFHVDSLDLLNEGFAAYGIDNTYGGVFTTPGSHDDTQFLSAGDHFMFLYFGAFTDGVAGSDAMNASVGNFSITASAVPEPATLCVFVAGLVTVARRRRKGTR